MFSTRESSETNDYPRRCNAALLQRGLVAAALLLVPIAAQAELTTFFGPETFTRSTGKPVTETSVFSLAGFRPPLILHLRNGDANGKHRASSAKVRVTTGPSLASNSS